MELAVFAVGEINEGRPSLASQGDDHLIGKLLAAHVFELREETRGSPAVKAAAVHIRGPLNCCDTDEQLSTGS